MEGKARRLKLKVDSALRAAVLVPAPVKDLIREMSVLLVDMAREVEGGKRGE